MQRPAIEEPLEIRVGGRPLAITMRTPGDDDELAIGFLIGEGLLTTDASTIRVGPPADLAGNTVDVEAPLLRSAPERRFYATSSCGVCGKGALEELAVLAPVIGDELTVSAPLLASLPERLAQPGFKATGGMHAAGLFDAAGTLLCEREDVGRHNALDKVIGAQALAGALPLSARILCVTGRLAFELVQKTAIAGCPVLVGVGAPTSLAITLAADRGITLCGFARGGDRVEVYSGAERVQP